MKEKKKTFNVQRSRESTQNTSGRAGCVQGLSERKNEISQVRVNGLGTKFDLEDRLLEFTARLIKLVDALPASRAGNHIAGQLLRCGTSPFANHGEVQAAESRKDFVHKLGVCFKELK